MLSDQEREILAEGHGLPPAVVEEDADTVLRWDGPQDDLLVELGREKGWDAELTVRYLASLRRALRRDPRLPE